MVNFDHPTLTVPLYLAEQGRAVRVDESRISLATIVYYHNAGYTPEQIVASFDTLTVARVYAVIAYYLSERDAIDEILAADQREADALRRKAQADPAYIALVAKMRARWEAKQHDATPVE